MKLFKRLSIAMASLAVVGMCLGGVTVKTLAAENVALTYAEEGNEDTAKYKAGVIFADKLKEVSDGAVTITIYGNGTMGATADIAASVMNGDLDMGSVEPGASVDLTLSVVDAPGIWANIDKAREVFADRDNEFNKLLDEAYAKLDLVNLAIVPSEGRIITTKNELSGPEAVKGLILRTPNADSIVGLWTAMGAVPTIIAMNETYLALQQGLADGQESAAGITVTSKFYEVNGHYYKTNHMLSKYGIMMNKDKWDSLSDEVKGFINKAVEEAMPEWIELFDSENDGYLDIVREGGCEVHECGEDWEAAFNTAAEGIINDTIRPQSGDAIVDAALAAMAEE